MTFKYRASKLITIIFTIFTFVFIIGSFFTAVDTFAAECTNTNTDATCTPPRGQDCASFGRRNAGRNRNGVVISCGARTSQTQTEGGTPNRPNTNTQTQTPAQNQNSQAQNNSNTGISNANANFFQILPFDCLFEIENRCENGLLNSLADFMVSLAVPLAVVVIMWGGYRYFLGGFEGKLEGMKTVQAGIIGLALVLTARFITNITNSVFNSDTGFDASGLTPLLTAITGALTGLALTLAILVIVWGGYKYFFGGLDGKSDGLKSIQAGVVGLVVISLAGFIANTTESLFSGLNTADQAVDIPNQILDVLEPILLQIVLSLQGLAALVAVLVIVWGGYKYFFSGLPNGKADGMDTIYKGVIGLVVTIIARPLVILINNTIGSSNDQLTLDPQSIIYILQVFITNFLIPISGALTAFFFILGAYQWLTAGGDSGKVKKGQDSIRNAVVGLIVVILATSFTQLIIFFFRNTDLIAPNSTDPITEQSPRQNSGSSTTPSQTPSTGGTPTRPSI
jgi:hypothetical protein